jgi:hypothetical protein
MRLLISGQAGLLSLAGSELQQRLASACHVPRRANLGENRICP